MTYPAKTTDKTGCAIVRATLADLDALALLFDAYRMFYRQPSDPEKARAFLRERIEHSESVIFLAQGNAGRALGFTQLYPCFSSVSAGRLWILNDLYVDPLARRHGIALALMEAAHRHAVDTGTLRMVLSTASDNTRAQALYRSLGYVQEIGMLGYTRDFV